MFITRKKKDDELKSNLQYLIMKIIYISHYAVLYEQRNVCKIFLSTVPDLRCCFFPATKALDSDDIGLDFGFVSFILNIFFNPLGPIGGYIRIYACVKWREADISA